MRIGATVAAFVCRNVRCQAPFFKGYTPRTGPYVAIRRDLCLFFDHAACSLCRDTCPSKAIELIPNPKADAIDVDAVLLATGFSPYNPCPKPYGYGRFRNVITSLDAERQLRSQVVLKRPSDGRPAERIAFIQCVGSRDTALGHPWCSKICCGSSLRMAQLIRSRQPGVQITCFYIDVQSFGKNFDTAYPVVQEQIEMIRAIPGDIFCSEEGDLRVVYFNANEKTSAETVFDVIILSVGLTPSPDNAHLAEIFHWRNDDNGFLKSKKGNGSKRSCGCLCCRFGDGAHEHRREHQQFRAGCMGNSAFSCAKPRAHKLFTERVTMVDSDVSKTTSRQSADCSVFVFGCGACARRIASSLSEYGVVVRSTSDFPSLELVHCSGFTGDFRLEFRQNGKKTTRQANAVVIAEDDRIEPNFDEYGLVSGSRVITLSDLEEKIDQLGAEDIFESSHKVAFLNGWEKESQPEVAGRMLALCHRIQTGGLANTFFFTNNLKVSPDGVERLCGQAKAAGAVFIKNTESIPRVSGAQNKTIAIDYIDELTRSSFCLSADWVIVDECHKPARQLSGLATGLRLFRDEAGFVQSDNVHRISNANQSPRHICGRRLPGGHVQTGANGRCRSGGFTGSRIFRWQ